MAAVEKQPLNLYEEEGENDHEPDVKTCTIGF